MNEEEHIRRARPVSRPHPLGEEVTRPERLGVCPQELVPGEPVPGLPGSDASLNQNPADRRSGDVVNPDLGQFAEDATEAESAFPGDPHDQLAHLDRLAWRPGSLLEPRWGWFAEPSRIGLGPHDRYQLVHGTLPQFLPEADERGSLLVGEPDAPFDLRSQDLILGLEKPDLAGELPARGTGENEERGVGSAWHRHTVPNLWYTGFASAKRVRSLSGG